MASLTVPPIATVTADGTAATYTLSIPAGSYPHLTVIAEVAGTTGIGLLQVQFNGDSGAHYTTEGTGNRDGQTSLFWGVVAAANSGPASVFISDIPLFASTTFYKYTETRSLRNDSLKFASAAVGGRWKSTAAITSITVTLGAGGNFASGSRIDVYAVGDSIPAATSGSLGVVEVDQSPTSGIPVALTTPRLGAPVGVAPLGGDAEVPSCFLPTLTGSTVEYGRWVRSSSNPILTATATWEGTAVCEASVVVDPTQYVLAYRGGWATTALGYATCPLRSDPTVAGNWTRYGSNPIYSGSNQQQPHLCKFGQTYYLYFAVSGGNWYVATTTSLTSWPTATLALATGGGVSQWANSSVMQDPDGTWHGLIEGLASGVWKIFLITSSNGLSWAVGNSGNPLSTLQVAGQAYSGPGLLPYTVNGLYHVYYHATTSGTGLPTDIYHATSPDLVTWTRLASNPVLVHLGGSSFEHDQVAGPSVFETYGTAYMTYDGDNNVADTAAIGIASVPNTTLHQVINNDLPALGTVTSVALSVPADETVTGSPITTAGTLAITRNAQAANLVLAGPSSGGPATPTYRALVAADLPAGLSPVDCILMTDGVTNPPVPLTQEDGTDYLYVG